MAYILILRSGFALPFFAGRAALVEKEAATLVVVEVADDTLAIASWRDGRRGIRKTFARAVRSEETCIFPLRRNLPQLTGSWEEGK